MPQHREFAVQVIYERITDRRRFGGIKHSGMGREGSKYGMEDYMTIKMIVTGGINTVYTSNL